MQTTAPGYVNRNEQEVVRMTGLLGNDRMQREYGLRSLKAACGYEHRVNGSDVFQGLRPACKGAAPGLAL